MKILYHHRTASKDGQDVHIEEMIAAMRRQGHDVFVVAPTTTENASFGHDGGTIARIKRHLPGALYELLELAYSLLAYRKLKRAYDSIKPDVLYERFNLFLLAGLWLKRRTGIRFLLEVNAPLAHERAAHGGLRLRALAEWAERTTWRGADYVLPVSNVLAETVRNAGVPESRIVVIHNGINVEQFNGAVDREAVRTQLGLTDEIVLGFTGFVREWHGLPDVLDAMAELKDKYTLHLLVVGDGPALANLKEHARTTGMAGAMTCVGLVERDRIPSYVSAFDIALQPKVVAYASPLKVFEYMALGRAIIAPDQANVREILTDGHDGLLFRPDDPLHFRQTLRRLCEDPELRLRLGFEAAQTIRRRKFTWDENVRRIVALATARN